jgi:hypothetical protein
LASLLIAHARAELVEEQHRVDWGDNGSEAPTETAAVVSHQPVGFNTFEGVRGMSAVYKARPIKPKRTRRTKDQMTQLRDGLFLLAQEHQPLTVRQLFYRGTVAGLIAKDQAVYNNTVVRLVGQMREEGRLPFDWIVDNTRWMRKPTTYSGLRSMLHYTQHTYRRAIWDNQEAYVEVWCESDSIAGVIYPVTQEWDVPLMPCGGQPSKSFLWTAAESMANEDKPCFVYYFGDYDKAGMDISARIKRDLERYLPDGTEFSFERVAINADQIEEFNLQTRPPKDKRGGFTETVELEAMTTQQLHAICRNCIEQHVDFAALSRLKRIEDAERDTLATIIDNLEAA